MEINEDREKELKELQFKLGYIFSNLSLLQKALTHSTYVNESQDKDIKDNTAWATHIKSNYESARKIPLKQ